jgi:hypothetical protein
MIVRRASNPRRQTNNEEPATAYCERLHTFSITNGIGAGFVSYVLIKLASGKAREVHPALYVVAALFLIYFLRWALFDARF